MGMALVTGHGMAHVDRAALRRRRALAGYGVLAATAVLAAGSAAYQVAAQANGGAARSVPRQDIKRLAADLHVKTVAYTDALAARDRGTIALARAELVHGVDEVAAAVRPANGGVPSVVNRVRAVEYTRAALDYLRGGLSSGDERYLERAKGLLQQAAQ